MIIAWNSELFFFFVQRGVSVISFLSGIKTDNKVPVAFCSYSVSSLSLTRSIFIKFSHAIIFKNKHLLINTLSNFRIY